MGRIGIYGGTFNPPHTGHVEAAKQMIGLLNLDRLLLIPSGQPPHKEVPESGPDGAERLRLLTLAARDLPHTEILDLELHRSGKSYTADTVTELSRLYPGEELFFIMGDDMFRIFPKWYEPEVICKYATLVVMSRQNLTAQQKAELCKNAEYVEQELRGTVLFPENRVLPMSSTNVRRMLAFDAIGDMIDPAVLAEIREKGLYTVNRPRKNLSMEGLEREVRELLDPKRVPHVFGVRDTAVYLAKKYGEDPVDAGRAGILHDITKALPPELQLQLCREYGEPLSEFEQKNPKTLHALTGGLVARRIYGENEAVVNAIFSHTTGCANMNTLQKIIYIADYMEPNRNFPGVEDLRAAVERDLNEAVKMGLQMTVDLLRSEGKEVAQGSLDAIASL